MTDFAWIILLRIEIRPSFYLLKEVTVIHFDYKERSKSANKTAISGPSFGASLGFHATTNRTDADFTL